MPTLPSLVARLRRTPVEALVWLGGLGALAATDPDAPGLLSLCVFKALGWASCPGCGLGHAVAYLLEGDVAASWQAHPLGVAALVVLLGRSAVLLYQAWRPLPCCPTSI